MIGWHGAGRQNCHHPGFQFPVRTDGSPRRGSFDALRCGAHGEVTGVDSIDREQPLGWRGFTSHIWASVGPVAHLGVASNYGKWVERRVGRQTRDALPYKGRESASATVVNADMLCWDVDDVSHRSVLHPSGSRHLESLA